MVSGQARILGPDGQPMAGRSAYAPVRRVLARYDAAQVTTESARHWAGADDLSARAANSPEVRRYLRRRARYERANAPYAQGMVLTLANDTIGTGPRLQITRQDDTDPTFAERNNAAVEEAFTEWAEAIGLAEKLRTMREARAVDGEAFALITTNPKLPTAVQLDIRLYEADQVATPYLDLFDETAVDGIEFDRYENPSAYHVLKSHPGDSATFGYGDEYTRVPADLMLHWFRRCRPGQCRGIPDITPAIGLFAQLRGYREAVMGAARVAASMAAVLQTTSPPDGEAAEIEQQNGPLTLDIETGQMVTVPEGWTMNQFKAEQPTTTYEMFKREILNEIARCLNMPYNVAAGNSSSYNYASGRLDHQTYYKALRVDQSHIETVILNRLFAAWLEEAKVATDLIPGDPDPAKWPHEWIWPGIEHVDPEKEANAQAIRLANGMTSFDEECQRQGIDPETRARNIGKGMARWQRLGLPLPSYMSPQSAPVGATNDED